MIEYSMWWCGDEWCDCYQPTVTHWRPNPKDRRFRLPTQLWAGDFHSEPDGEEWRRMQAQLGFACLMGLLTNHQWLRHHASEATP